MKRKIALLLLILIGWGCSSNDSNDSNNTNSNNANHTNNTNNAQCDASTQPALIENFMGDSLVSPIEEVDCQLSDGTQTTCYKIVIKGAPMNHDAGPYCPRSINDGPDAAGIWLEGGEVYDVDGAFIKNLATFYKDDRWKLYDEETGMVRVTDTQEACEAAARPDVEEQYQNHCVECELSYVDGGVPFEIIIPKVPVPADAPSSIGRDGVGVALNGVKLEAPAPVDAILGAYTIAAFDDCGGHVNTVVGYHYHAETGCAHRVKQCDAHAPLIGYAMDGYAIYAMKADGGQEPTDLDECRGHTDDIRGYHYHAASAGENMFLGCFKGKMVGGNDGPPNNMMGGMNAMQCTTPDQQQCCGDGVCDGPETAENCQEDCS